MRGRRRPEDPLDEAGSEWRNRVQLGSVPRWFSELYVPLGAGSGPASDWFIALSTDLSRRRQTTYRSIGPDEDGLGLSPELTQGVPEGEAVAADADDSE